MKTVPYALTQRASCSLPDIAIHALKNMRSVCTVIKIKKKIKDSNLEKGAVQLWAAAGCVLLWHQGRPRDGGECVPEEGRISHRQIPPPLTPQPLLSPRSFPPHTLLHSSFQPVDNIIPNYNYFSFSIFFHIIYTAGDTEPSPVQNTTVLYLMSYETITEI